MKTGKAKVLIILTHVLTCIAIQCGWFFLVGILEATRADSTEEIVWALIFIAIGCGPVALDFFVCRRLFSEAFIEFRTAIPYFIDLILLLPLLLILYNTTFISFDSKELPLLIALLVPDALLVVNRIRQYRNNRL